MINSDDSSSRRRFLKYTAAGSLAGITGLAGCSGDGSDGSSDGDGSDGSSDGGGSNGGSSDGGSDEQISVYLMLPDQTVPRYYNQDAPAFKEAIKERQPDWEVVVQDAGGSSAEQLTQVENAITSGADTIALMAAVPNEAGGTLQSARDADVPVILHEHGAQGGLATARAAYDAFASGVAEGEAAKEVIDGILEEKDTVNVARVYGLQGGFWGTQIKKGQDEVLQPMMEDGTVNVLAETWTNWSAEQTRTFAEDTLTQYGGKLDMFIVSHDAGAEGVFQALTAQNYEPGEIMISGGQNGNVVAAQLILGGWLHDTYYKPIPKLAEVSAQLCIAAAKDEELPDDLINGEYENDVGTVPAVQLEGQTLTEENIGVLQEQGLYTWEEMCDGVEGSEKCERKLS